MKADFPRLALPSVYKYPWSVTAHLYFLLSESPLRVKSSDQEEYINFPTSFIIGPRLLNDIVDFGKHNHVLGITFRPGGLYRLFGIPLTEFKNREDLSLISRQTSGLTEKLVNAETNQKALEIVEQFLLSKLNSLRPITPFDRVMSEINYSNGNLSIKEAANRAGISMRQFERKALACLGVSPKLFNRVTRFSNTCIYKEANPSVPWIRVTYEFGYADQMHLINDFKAFVGTSPGNMENQMALKLLTGVEGRH